MTLKNMFLTYVELEKCAEDMKAHRGTSSFEVADAFAKANNAKRVLLDALEEIDDANRTELDV